YRWLPLRRPARFVTWMRDPVERLASHYHFWNRQYNPRTARPLHRQVVEEAWPFERFYRSPELLNVYTQFLWGFPVAAFDFIGVTEYYDEDFRFFVEAFLGGVSLPTYRVETNAARQSERYVTDPGVRAEIEAFLHRDMALYRHALRMRQRRTERPVAGGQTSGLCLRPFRLPSGRLALVRGHLFGRDEECLSRLGRDVTQVV